MKSIEYLDLEYKTIRSKTKKVSEDMTIKCNIKEHKHNHNHTGEPMDNFIIDLLMNLGENLEKQLSSIERIITSIKYDLTERNKLIKENIERINQQSLILEDILKKTNKYKHLEIGDIINAIITAKEFKKPKLIKTETDNTLKEIYKIIKETEEKLKTSLEYDLHINNMMNKTENNFKRLFGD